MRNGSNLKELLKGYKNSYKSALLDSADTYKLLKSARSNPSILMSDAVKSILDDEESRKRYTAPILKDLEKRINEDFKEAKEFKKHYLDLGGDPKELEEIDKEIKNSIKPKARATKSDREEFKKSFSILMRSFDKIKKTSNRKEIKEIYKIIHENTEVIQKLGPVLGDDIVNEVIEEISKEEKTRESLHTSLVHDLGTEERAVFSDADEEDLDDDIKIYEPAGSIEPEEPETEELEPEEIEEETEESLEELLNTLSEPEETPEPEETLEPEVVVAGTVAPFAAPAATSAATTSTGTPATTGAAATTRGAASSTAGTTTTAPATTGATVTRNGSKSRVGKAIKSIGLLVIAGLAIYGLTQLPGCSNEKVDIDRNTNLDNDKQQVVQTATSETPAPSETPVATPAATPAPTETPAATPLITPYSNTTSEPAATPLITPWTTNNENSESKPLVDFSDSQTSEPAKETPVVTPTVTPEPTPEPTEEVQTFEWTDADQATIDGVNYYMNGEGNITEQQRSGYRSIIGDELDKANSGEDQYQNYNAAVTLGEKFMDGQSVDGTTIDQLNANQRAAFISDMYNALSYADADGVDITGIKNKLADLDAYTQNELKNQKTLVKTYN